MSKHHRYYAYSKEQRKAREYIIEKIRICGCCFCPHGWTRWGLDNFASNTSCILCWFSFRISFSLYIRLRMSGIITRNHIISGNPTELSRKAAVKAPPDRAKLQKRVISPTLNPSQRETSKSQVLNVRFHFNPL